MAFPLLPYISFPYGSEGEYKSHGGYYCRELADTQHPLAGINLHFLDDMRGKLHSCYKRSKPDTG